MTKALDPKNFNLSADQSRHYWHCDVPNDTLIEDVLKPAFWVHVISRLKPRALIDVVSFDGLLDMQVRVQSITNGIAVVRPRLIFEDKVARAPVLATLATDSDDRRTGNEKAFEAQLQAPEGYKIGWNPGKKIFYVQLKASGQILADNVPTKDEALKFAIKHADVANAPMGQTTQKSQKAA